jgi:hypothetical protein
MMSYGDTKTTGFGGDCIYMNISKSLQTLRGHPHFVLHPKFYQHMHYTLGDYQYVRGDPLSHAEYVYLTGLVRE